MLRRALVELAAGLEDGRTGCVAALTGVQPLAWDGGQVLRRWSVVEIARRVPCADRPHAFFALHEQTDNFGIQHIRLQSDFPEQSEQANYNGLSTV